MAGIFISYRRDDSAGHTGRLMDDLKQQFEPQQIFRDIETIEAGADFVEAIDRAVGSCSVLLAMIGARWLDAKDVKGRRRLEDEHDFVRLEIVTALNRNVRVIPLLVGGAAMPGADELPEALKLLARRNAHELSDKRWDYDVEQLFNALEKLPGIARRKPSPGPAPGPSPDPSPTPRPLPEKKGMSTGTKVVLGVAFFMIVGLISQVLEVMKQPQPAVDDSALALSQLDAPQPVSPPRAERKPAVSPAPVRNDTPRPAAPNPAEETVTSRQADEPPQPRPAALNLTGTWSNDDGDKFIFEQKGTIVSSVAADASGMHGFVGQGMLNGRALELQLVHLQSGGQVTMQVNVSANGQRMTGMAREHITGSSQEVELVRD